MISAGQSVIGPSGDVMTIEQVRHAYNTKPFQPFVLHLADGRNLSVQHPENMAFSPSGRTITVYQDDDASHIIDLLLVTALEVKTTVRGPGKRSRS
jgi:hypothetical protein